MVARDIIVIGASAGGMSALPQLVAGLPADLPAAVFICLHMFERNESILPDLLNDAGPLRACMAQEGMPITAGHIYIAPPDQHLLLSPQRIYLSHGPKEGLQRPSINVMFRSASTTFGDRVAGIVLTGLLDDGSAGLWEILQRGGAAIVQDPDEAAYRSMPENAIRSLSVQYIVQLKEMAPLLTRLSMGEKQATGKKQNIQAMSGGYPDISSDKDAPLTRQACPGCGGVMKLEMLGDIREYVCHVGHRLGLQSMIADKTDVVERTMWKAMSQSEELIELLEHARDESDSASRNRTELEIQERRGLTERLRKLLLRDETGASD